MNVNLLRIYADELAWLMARLNRRTAEMETMDPESQDYRDAVRVADFLAREITAVLQKVRAYAASQAPALSEQNSLGRWMPNFALRSCRR